MKVAYGFRLRPPLTKSFVQVSTSKTYEIHLKSKAVPRKKSKGSPCPVIGCLSDQKLLVPHIKRHLRIIGRSVRPLPLNYGNFSTTDRCRLCPPVTQVGKGCLEDHYQWFHPNEWAERVKVLFAEADAAEDKPASTDMADD